MATNTYVALNKATVSGTVSSITLTGISQAYTDLILISSYGSGNTMYMQFNSDTSGSSTNYSNTVLWGNGTTTGTTRNSNTFRTYYAGYWVGSDTNVGGNVAISHLQNYANTNVYKTILSRSAQATQETDAIVGLWRSTAAITSITIGVTTGNLAVGSTFSLYGVLAEGTSPAPKATGGSIYSDSTYYYHVFGATGTFTPTQSISADVLVVAGGGGAGGASSGGGGGGGGGAGGLLGFTSQSLTATGYTVTVGAGGAGGSTNAQGSNGGNSQFGALTACVGGGGGGNYQSSGVENGLSGGSGGGAGQYHSAGHTGGSGTSGQGNAGGPVTTPAYTTYGGGSGGGAGAAGEALVSYATNTGGAGSSAYSSWGVATGTGQNVSGTYYYAGGGGAGVHTSNDNSGGLGGGGVGGTTSTTSNSYGKPNTGGGGGHGYNSGAYNGSAGGSGIVIVRYAK